MTSRSLRVARLNWLLAAAAAMLAACGGGGGNSSAPAPAPTVTLAASAKDVAVNGSDTLTWTSTNASGCVASGGWSGSLAPSGSKAVTVAASATYTITCTGSGGSANASTGVTAWSAPHPVISADTTSLLANNTVQLTWSSTNATACTGQDGLAGVSVGTSGSETSPELTATTVFSIACSNPAFGPVKGSVTVSVSTTYTAVITVSYQVPGAPVLSGSFYVPDWANPEANPVPFVWVEMQDPSSHVVSTAYADASGKATLTGLNPAVVYTPVIRSKMSDPALGLDFVVLNNTAPVDTSQPTYRARYAPYANAGPAYTADKRSATQSLGTLTATDGWDSTQNGLVDAKRFAGPYALLANATREAQIVSAAIGGKPAWRPLTILWSVRNKGGLSAPPNETDQGYVTGVGGFYNSGHKGVDASGTETGAQVSEDFEFLSGDQTTEPMDIYPWVLTHEMGHFTQSLFSTLETPGGNHSYFDYQDPTLAWIEGNASGIAALVLNTSSQNRVVMNAGVLTVNVFDIADGTVNGNPQGWPLGWFQESTTTRLMWELYDPNGTIRLSAPAVLAPMYSTTWTSAPWLNTPWAYAVQLAKTNTANTTAIDSLSDSLHIKATGDDEWGAAETSAGDRTTKDALAPYTTVTIGGGPVQMCSAGAPNDYNKESNVRYLRVMGDGATHKLTVTGPTGTVPLVNRFLFTAGSSTYTDTGTIDAGYLVLSIGDCSVADSQFSSNTAACSEPATPATEQCWSVSVQ